MFDYVSRETFNSEHELRLRAEASLERASAHIVDLYETNTLLLKMLGEERQRHEEAMRDALDRFAPKPKDPVPGFGVPGATELTYEQIMKMPAVGRRGIKERNAAALDAKQREEMTEQQNDAESRRAVLTPDEEAAVDKQIAR